MSNGCQELHSVVFGVDLFRDVRVRVVSERGRRVSHSEQELEARASSIKRLAAGRIPLHHPIQNVCNQNKIRSSKIVHLNQGEVIRRISR